MVGACTSGSDVLPGLMQPAAGASAGTTARTQGTDLQNDGLSWGWGPPSLGLRLKHHIFLLVAFLLLVQSRLCVGAQEAGGVALAIAIQVANLQPPLGQCTRNVQGGGGLGNAAFVVVDDQPLALPDSPANAEGEGVKNTMSPSLAAAVALRRRQP